MDADTRVGCYAWVEQDGQVLLPHWREHSGERLATGWTLPGGGVEPGESLLETMVREVAEESGYAVTPGPLLGVRNHWVSGERRLRVPGRPLQAVQIVWLATITGGELTVEADGSTDDVRWHRLEDLPGLDAVSVVADAAAWARQAGGHGG